MLRAACVRATRRRRRKNNGGGGGGEIECSEKICEKAAYLTRTGGKMWRLQQRTCEKREEQIQCTREETQDTSELEVGKHKEMQRWGHEEKLLYRELTCLVDAQE